MSELRESQSQHGDWRVAGGVGPKTSLSERTIPTSNLTASNSTLGRAGSTPADAPPLREPLKDSAQNFNADASIKAPLCQRCGGPHPFDTSIPSVVWNAVIRERGYPDYLCLFCILAIFDALGQSFTAQLWGASFHGKPMEVRFDAVANDAALLSEENTDLRVQLAERTAHLEAQHVYDWRDKETGRLYRDSGERIGEYRMLLTRNNLKPSEQSRAVTERVFAELFEPAGDAVPRLEQRLAEAQQRIRELETANNEIAEANQTDAEHMDNIPEFTEPRFWVEFSNPSGWCVMYRAEGRVLCLAPPWSTERLARNQCRVLNDLIETKTSAAEARLADLTARLAPLRNAVKEFDRGMLWLRTEAIPVVDAARSLLAALPSLHETP